jgi:hypothetical protein
VIASVLLKDGGWVNLFLVEVQITDSVFETKSICLAAPSVDPSPTSDSFILGILGEHLVIGFLGGGFPIENKNL